MMTLSDIKSGFMDGRFLPLTHQSFKQTLHGREYQNLPDCPLKLRWVTCRGFQSVKCHWIVLNLQQCERDCPVLQKHTSGTLADCSGNAHAKNHSCWNRLLISLSLLQPFIHWVFILGKGRAEHMYYKALIITCYDVSRKTRTTTCL